jgi:CheY-like chemotaxis protein
LARKILLADDSVTAQNMGRKILADAGYEVITVNNGSAALKKIAEQKPDLIVLDVYMPGYSGLEVCQRLKEAQETARVPVLLTVGKLEPFKPEEAKRVRADGFIVKPFEASELLSALSKLEDKIVPRAEPSKPGRFARATAALDEGRYDKSVANDEDSGWKNRINFPTKKKDKDKDKVEQEDGDESTIYNAMNKDLRTVVENRPAEQPRGSKHEARAEEAKVDLGALAPEGLPKDVTPEEIAALAAAAAQVKGKIADVAPTEPDPVEAKVEVKTESRTEARTETKSEVKAESAPQAPEAVQPAADLPREIAPQEITVAQAPVATFAGQKSDEKTEDRIEAPKEAASIPAPSPADVMAAIAGLEVDAVTSAAATSGNGSWSHAKDKIADEPVTMAVAAGAESHAAASRWTAVSVALAPEEAAISLEQEMQKAYAAFAAAETGHSAVVTAPERTQPGATEPAPAESAIAAAAAMPLATVPASPAPEAAQALSAMANAATDAITSAVKELEAVAASYLEHKNTVTAQSEPAPVEKAEAATALVPEASQKIEPSVIEPSIEDSVAASAPPAPETPKFEANPEAAKPDAPQTWREEPKNEEPKNAELKHEAEQPGEPENQDSKSEVAAPVAGIADPVTEEVSKTIEGAPETAAPGFVDAVPAGQHATEQVAEQPSASPASSNASAAVTGEPAASGSRDSAHHESEIAANTAAAWASWRRIRESAAPEAQPEPASSKEVEETGSASQDAAAMAVAAGAEKTPEEASAASDAAPASDQEGIASLVDSVLAEMRPKIYEEISRKMKKK